MYSKEFLENPVKYNLPSTFSGENIVNPTQEVRSIAFTTAQKQDL
jgi:hypothetical protein